MIKNSPKISRSNQGKKESLAQKKLRCDKTRDELRLVRGFTERFMRLMANYVDEIDDATEN